MRRRICGTATTSGREKIYLLICVHYKFHIYDITSQNKIPTTKDNIKCKESEGKKHKLHWNTKEMN